MTEDTYNGWTNYETWLVALWIDNEEWMQLQAYAIVRDARANAEHPDFARGNAAEALRDYVECFSPALEVPELRATLWSDLLGAALSKVDWREVADHYIETEAEVS